ncbi:MAG TPA: hypothetical protein VNT60_03645 [Deinococcales bacterium]|nr:hypothetical protein [Deinococcales bacterium]
MKLASLRSLSFAAVTAAAIALPSAAQAAPVAYVERSFSVAGGLAFAGSPFGIVSVELPLSLPLPIDFSVAVDAGYKHGGPMVGATAKALLLPSLLGNPPLALAVVTRLSGGDVSPIGQGPRFSFGPLVSLDYSPFVFSASIMGGIGGGPIGADLALTGTYYTDPLALDLTLAYSTGVGGQVGLALRYLF